jgi:hypothetical protein
VVWNFTSRIFDVDVDWNTPSSMSDRLTSLTDHLDPDHLYFITWIISTPSPGSSRQHHTSPALPKVQRWVGDWLNVPRSRLISYSLSRLALSVLFFPSFHALPQRPTHAFRIWRWLPSCLDFARAHPILLHQADPHNHSPSSLNCCCFGSPSASRLFLFSPSSWLLH